MSLGDDAEPALIACAQCGARIEPFDATLSRGHHWICKSCDAGLRYQAQVAAQQAAAAHQQRANQAGAAAAVGVGAVASVVIVYVLIGLAFAILVLYVLYKIFSVGPYYGTP